MTLNITAITRDHIFQSADCRLSSQREERSAITTNKLIKISQKTWSGCLTYTGIGLDQNSRHTAQVVSNWLAGVAWDASVSEVVERIRSHATLWMGSFALLRHTFVLAIIADTTSVAVISNFQDAKGRYNPPTRAFRVDFVERIRRPQIILTGYTHDPKDARFNTLIRAERRRLLSLLENYTNDPLAIRRALQASTRRIARVRPNLISEECAVISVNIAGAGHVEGPGNQAPPPATILGGIDLGKLLKSLGLGSEAVFGGQTFAASGRTRIPASECKPRVAAQTDSDLELHFLAVPLGSSATVLAGNERGAYCGRITTIESEGKEFPGFWKSDGSPVELSHGGGYAGVASWIAPDGTVFGSTEAPDRRMIACSWSPLSLERSDFGIGAGRHSEVAAGNVWKQVVGYASLHPTEGGQIHQRPAVWKPNGSGTVHRDIPADWGEAVDINDEGQIICRLHKGKEVGAYMWTERTFEFLGYPHPDIAVVWPRRILPDGSVVALTISKTGERGCFWRATNGHWASLMEPKAQREFTSAYTDLSICGYEKVDGYIVPWIKRDGGVLTYLSYLPAHHHDRLSFTRRGTLVGHASADYCRHPLVWS